MTIQNYEDRPSVSHFWVYCSRCGAHKLYWPTVAQLILADVLACATLTDDEPPDEVLASYERDAGHPPDRVVAPPQPTTEIAFLVNMLAATAQAMPHEPPQRSYLPSHWSN